MPKSKGSAIMRIAKYFRETEFDEARMAYKLVEEIMDKRFRDSANDAKSQARAVESRPKRQGQRKNKRTTNGQDNVQSIEYTVDNSDKEVVTEQV